MPEMINEILGFTNTLLMPAPNGSGARKFKGSQSETAVTQSALTALTRMGRIRQQPTLISRAQQRNPTITAERNKV